MIPLVGIVKEFEEQKKIVDEEARAIQDREKIEIEYSVGTMLELPRAALVADEIAAQAEFLLLWNQRSDTDDFLGFSRDDAGKFLPTYFAMGILDRESLREHRRQGRWRAGADRGGER